MTDASRIPVTLDGTLLALAPAKVQPYLTKALKRGLTVWQNTTITPGHLGYTIASSNPIDDWQLWLYFTAGARTGSLTINRYDPWSTAKKTKTTKLTHQMAAITIDGMGDALDRHNARVAQAEDALRQVGDELDGKVITLDSATVATATGDAARRAAVRAVQAAPAPNADPDAQALAVAALGSLKANAKFALRAARAGALPHNIPGKVRHALVRRGLVAVAGGMLTDVGRVARSMILNP
jgi:hypothetical protein